MPGEAAVREEAGVRLRELATLPEILEVRGDLDVEVKGLASHSGRVQPGDLFVAVPGTAQDGHDYLQEAAQRGAVAAVVERFQDPVCKTLTQLRVADSRRAMAHLAARFYGEPANHLKLIGITGTNGKTTTAHVLEAILEAAGHQVGVLGTIAYRWGGHVLPASNTTPDSIELQRLLAQMSRQGISHVVMEVTSHALEQKRVLGCRFQVGIFTNLTRDHLDYHGSMEAYLEAKTTLFKEHLKSESQGGWAFLNLHDPASPVISQVCSSRVIWYGLGSEGDVKALEWKGGRDGSRILLDFPEGRISLESPLIGEPNVLNVVAACGCAWALGVEPEKWREGIRRLKPVPGRMERIDGPDLPSGFTVLVDYAHTPDALDRALATARKLASAKLIVVFGCGGDRDRGKRPMMAQAAARHCDLAVVTSDNPRNEEPMAIIQEIVKGFQGTRLSRIDAHQSIDVPAYTILEDRQEAIRWAVGHACPGDVVLIAGKGHENYQILGNKRIPLTTGKLPEELCWKRAHEYCTTRVSKPGGDSGGHGRHPLGRRPCHETSWDLHGYPHSAAWGTFCGPQGRAF